MHVGYDEIMVMMVCGLLSFCALTVAWMMFFCKGYVISAILSICTVLLVFLSAKNWLVALVSSGKKVSDAGLQDYPPVPITFGALVLAALVCLVLSLVFLKKKLRNTEEPGEAEEEE